MVVKTETCSFSGLRIYPGHGIFFVRGDSKGFKFINRKTKSLFTQRLNPRKISWTQLYRRMHKKGTLEDTQKKSKRKVSKGAPKAVVGASLELIKQKRNQKPEVRAAAREAALREIKERAKAKQAEKKKVVAKPVQAEKKAREAKERKERLKALEDARSGHGKRTSRGAAELDALKKLLTLPQLQPRLQAEGEVWGISNRSGEGAEELPDKIGRAHV